MGCEKDRGNGHWGPCVIAFAATQIFWAAIFLHGIRTIAGEFKALQTTVLKITTDAAQAHYEAAMR